jgi:hypothetical protein
MKFPEDSEKFKNYILKIIEPIHSPNDKRISDEYFFGSQRSEAGRRLPPYYLVYFLFVDLLKFKDLGRSEKTAWSIPIEYNGKIFLISYRKMGLGVFIHDVNTEEKEAQEIVKKIKKAIMKTEPYFDFIAESTVNNSKVNVINNSSHLYKRYIFLLKEYKKRATKIKNKIFDFKKQEKANWLALATIDAFYSWTEHVFVHIAIITGKIHTGKEVVDFAAEEWKDKYKLALELSTKESIIYFDKLVSIKSQLRNYYAHGAFGKEGEAFKFHSATGAVPVQINRYKKSKKYSLYGPQGFNESDAIQTIDSFIKFMWTGKLLPAKMYIQESDLSTVLPFSSDGTYSKAMRSAKDMKQLIDIMIRNSDKAADMDW